MKHIKRYNENANSWLSFLSKEDKSGLDSIISKMKDDIFMLMQDYDISFQEFMELVHQEELLVKNNDDYDGEVEW